MTSPRHLLPGHPDPIALEARLESAYDEPHRRYHNRDHLVQVAGAVERHAPAEDLRPLLLAAWFHDAVYDPRARDNEARSAARARSEITDPEPADRVARLILATRDHVPFDDSSALLLDADLAILGADPAAYRAYALAIRQEYVHVPDGAFRQGRAAILRGLLARPSIYRSAAFEVLEARARANVRDEMEELMRDVEA